MSRLDEKRFTCDISFAIKNTYGLYYCGLKVWDKQVRKAKLYHSRKYAEDILKEYPDSIIVRVRIEEMFD